MPRIPSTVPTLNPNAAPAVRQSAAGATPDAFGGAMGRAFESVGNNVTKLSMAGMDYVAKQREEEKRKADEAKRKADADAAQRAFAAYQDEVQRRTYGDGGWLSRRGYDAAGVADSAGAELDDLGRKLGEGLNDEARRAYSGFALTHRLSTTEMLRRHQQSELTAAEDSTRTTIIGNAIDAYSSDATPSQLGIIESTARDHAARKGWSPDVTNSFVADNVGRAHEKFLSGVLSRIGTAESAKDVDGWKAQAEGHIAASGLDAAKQAQWKERAAGAATTRVSQLRTLQQQAAAEEFEQVAALAVMSLYDPNVNNFEVEQSLDGIAEKYPHLARESATLKKTVTDHWQAVAERQETEQTKAREQAVNAQLNTLKVNLAAGKITPANYRDGVMGVIRASGKEFPNGSLPELLSALKETSGRTSDLERDGLKWLTEQRELNLFGDQVLRETNEGESANVTEKVRLNELRMAEEDSLQKMDRVRRQQAIRDSLYNHTVTEARRWLNANPNKTLEDFQKAMREGPFKIVTNVNVRANINDRIQSIEDED